ncbi:hypothetical protein BAUCODRAFT_69308 [Baudoinia panamericana UAMH 10762]|uniref:Protein kinase domain-containing protein n=1 Tax=Baudoinia panamericana (strain UAMH 10762) TaxID=717646 RepID=M2LRS8_BAUPA|nr:uncharacterized protein BAUCODRAFT_69308 [Baudoinia panamericana UAMH 10762]EMC97172.1 hypothetical protein BAUCODRAFT_69308 [Baudoinia panamericana UAMH 10762]
MYRGRDHVEHSATAAEQDASAKGSASTQPSQHPRSHSAAEAGLSLAPSHGISINLPDAAPPSRPPMVKMMSAPTYSSPIRHHRRAPSKTKNVKETLNAKSHYGSSDDDEGAAVHRINQYIIKSEIGRGSFGAVHLCVDQYGNEYAVKEFSKARLRKRAQSNLLRKPNQGQRRPGHLAAGLGFNSPLHRQSTDQLQRADTAGSLDLIKEEIAIMKKLNHNNLVNLIEVLDDPQEDSLYMVLEYCKKGVVMKVGLDERAEPYEEEACRCWFRDMILGIEYLHAQGIIHRDIKPDNCLVTEEDELKIVDFGVSEMFEKQSDMATAKSAGSPAFMPPELCVARHGQVSGRAADIWSMGVTLYCLRYGRIPFEKSNLLELYQSIREDELSMDGEQDERFKDMMRKLLEKEPEKRITMEGLRQHPWVTKDGTDPLLSAEENCADLIEPPTEAEMNQAITGNMAYLMTVMRAVKRFKQAVNRKHPDRVEGIFGRQSRLVAPPTAMDPRESRSTDAHDRRPMETILVTAGVHRDVDVDDEMNRLPHDLDRMHTKPATVDIDQLTSNNMSGETEGLSKQRHESNVHRHHPSTSPEAHRHTTMTRAFTLPEDDHAKGHAHDPLTDTLFLGLNQPATSDDATNTNPTPEINEPLIVSESPPAVELNIYEQAYQEEMQRIMERRGGEAGSMYLTRRVEHRADLRSHSSILDAPAAAARRGKEKLAQLFGDGLASVVKQAKQRKDREEGMSPGPKLEMSGSAAAAKVDADAAEILALATIHAERRGRETEEDEGRKAGIDGTMDPEGSAAIIMTKAHAQAAAQRDAAFLDAGGGAMPGMPGGFPVTPGVGAKEGGVMFG